jgi:CRISPR/Cas system CMR-associated protein Cmr1 (group 7 of RAMP superfamily)
VHFIGGLKELKGAVAVTLVHALHFRAEALVNRVKMNKKIYNLEFITPCFCAGAEQTVAELRASAVRGELRWWFRVLGGSGREEDEVFGGVRGNSPTASSLWVRARALARQEKKIGGRSSLSRG